MQYLFKPVERFGKDALIYPLGSPAAEYMVPCRSCGTEHALQKNADESNLEGREQKVMLAHWKVPNFSDHPGWCAQRRRGKQIMSKMLQVKAGLLTLWGDYGSGKTMGAWVMVNEMRTLHNARGYFATFAEVLENLRGMYGKDQDTSDYWERMLSIPVLAIDEITRFNESSQWAQEKLAQLVDTRYRKRDTHMTILTTNENPNQRYEDEDRGLGYLFSRMMEGELVELGGDVRPLVHQ